MKYKVNKFKDIFFPVELDKLPVIKENKSIPLIYTGHNFTQVPAIKIIYEILDKTIGKSMYAQLIAPMHQRSIHGYYEKMNLLSDTKIALIHNVLQPIKLSTRATHFFLIQLQIYVFLGILKRAIRKFLRLKAECLKRL